MITKGEKERLRQRFMAKAEEVFEKAMASGKEADELSLSEIEETVEGLKFELTGTLVESVVEVRNKGERGPGPMSSATRKAPILPRWFSTHARRQLPGSATSSSSIPQAASIPR